jgi:hypothetical protein
MFTTLRRHMSFANVGAATALVLTTTGVAVGATSSGGKINACADQKSGALRLVKGSAKCTRGERAIAWNRVGVRGAAGSIGPAGAPGLMGATGPAGPKGDAGATRVTERSSAGSLASPNGNFGSALANCLPGERATGGGWSFLQGEFASLVVIYNTALVGTDGAPTGWTVTYRNGSTSLPLKVSADVICAAP